MDSCQLFRDLMKEIIRDAWFSEDLHFSKQLATKAQKALDLFDRLDYSNGIEYHAEFLELLEGILNVVIKDMENRLLERGKNKDSD